MTPEEQKQYQKEYYEKNKDRIREQAREYRKKNREKLNAQKVEYYSRPENKAKKAAKGAREYLANRDKVLARQAVRRKERMDYINGVALQYRCQNPECKWQGEFKSYQLCFHHLDPTIKETEVSRMESWSMEKIKVEINKCVVLCLNCHPLVHKGDIIVNESMLCSV